MLPPLGQLEGSRSANRAQNEIPQMKKPRQNRASSQRWALAFAVVAVGCGGADDAGLTGGNSDSEGGGTSSSGGAGSGGSNTGGGASTGGGGSSAEGGTNTGGTGGGSGRSCPEGLPGPQLVLIDVGDDAFCIDSTEITQIQYSQFVPHAGTTPAHPRCGFNESVVPPNPADLELVDPPAPPTLIYDAESPKNVPVVMVDWCDAHLYCAWAGKRLCGGRAGVVLTAAADADPAQSEWAAACSADGTRDYPYGNEPKSGVCNDETALALRDGEPTLTAPKEMPLCEGGYPGLYDMAGNVGEWIGACTIDEGTPDVDRCSSADNFFAASATWMACAKQGTAYRRTVDVTTGIRCCADAL